MSEAPKHGTFCWNELITGDIAKAKDFYTQLLGWSADDVPEATPPYAVWKLGETMAGGLMQKTEEMGDVPPHWLSYITVDDVDASAKKVEELGGKICVPPTDIPNVGRFTAITDPTGAAVCLITFPKQ